MKKKGLKKFIVALETVAEKAAELEKKHDSSTALGQALYEFRQTIYESQWKIIRAAAVDLTYKPTKFVT